MPPIILNKPVEMLKASIVVPKTYVDKLFSILHEEGALHITKVGKGVDEYIEKMKRLQDVLNKINYLLSFKPGAVLDISLTAYELRQITIEDIREDVDKIYVDVKSLESSIEKRSTELNNLANIHSITKYLPGDYRVKYILYRGKHLSIITIYGKSDNVQNFITENKIPVIYNTITDEIAIAIIVIESSKFDNILRKISLSGLKYLRLDKDLIEKYNTVDQLNMFISRRMAELNTKVKELKEKLDNIISQSLQDLGKYRVIVENMINKIEALLNISSLKYLTLVTGWVPKKKANALLERLKSEGIPAYVEYSEPSEDEQPPTLLENPRVIRYYEPIVKFIGIPNYYEWDPTPILAYSFALFYGIMLGDMGYAIAIILAAFLVLDKFVVDIYNRDYQLFKRSLVVSSAVGFVVGALSGTLFGDSLAIAGLKYAITNVFNDPIMFLSLSLIIGLIHVNIAHAIALAKHLKRKNIGDAISEIGLFIAEIFGIPYVMYTMLNTPVPIIPEDMIDYLLWLALIGVALIIIGMIKSIGGLGILMWLFNLTGLLGDVLSYSRLAGVGLATIYLASSFNLMAVMIYNGISNMLPPIIGPIVAGILAVLVAFLGHLINTALSALGSFIHSLRLCFVEFLTKFYEGDGYPFSPFKVVLRKRMVIE